MINNVLQGHSTQRKNRYSPFKPCISLTHLLNHVYYSLTHLLNHIYYSLTLLLNHVYYIAHSPFKSCTLLAHFPFKLFILFTHPLFLKLCILFILAITNTHTHTHLLTGGICVSSLSNKHQSYLQIHSNVKEFFLSKFSGSQRFHLDFLFILQQLTPPQTKSTCHIENFSQM